MTVAFVRLANRRRITMAVAALVVALALPPIPPASAQTSTIAFLNPSPPPEPSMMNPFNHPVVSDRSAGGDDTYRLAAWVANPPANPIVEFEIDVSAALTIVLSPAQRVAPDTWEFQWDIPDQVFDDFGYTMRVILFDGDTLTEVARDELVVNIIRGEVDPNTGAARVELVLPQNGTEAGFFIPPGQDQPANTVTRFVRSGNANFVRPAYTLTAPGQRPEWKNCGGGAQRTGYSAAGGLVVRCTLMLGDDPNQVRAVRVLANSSVDSDLILPQNDGATDAVRVTPYMQQPTSLFVTEAITRAPGQCTTDFVTTVHDQIGRPIAAANIDVHAVGPSDQLRFDTRSGNALRARPPEHGNHALQAGTTCPGGAAGADQGNHRRPGIPDIKHVQSLAGGTSNTGTFAFALRSPDEGETHITAWADINDSDGWDTGEPCAATAVGWGAESPPAPQAEFVGCSTGAPPPPPQLPPAAVSFQQNNVTGATGGTVTLRALVVNEQGQPVANEPVTWDVTGTGEVVSQDNTTDSGGRATIRLTSEDEGEQVVTVSTNRCVPAGDCSDTATVTWQETVEVVVTRGIGLQRLTRPAPNRLRARGRVRGGGRPACARRVPVRIQRRVGGQWRVIRSRQTNRRRFYQARFPRPRPHQYRAVARRVIRTSPQGERLVCRRAVSRIRRG